MKAGNKSRFSEAQIPYDWPFSDNSELDKGGIVLAIYSLQ